jgi:molybdate transport system substrate-binding protein
MNRGDQEATMMRRAVIVLFIFMFLAAVPVAAQQLRIAAAADLQFALGDLAAQYEKQTGVKLSVTYGSSGNFFAQIENGAPFDLFFSADITYPQKLIDKGLAARESLYSYAFGRIVLWVPRDSPLDPAKLHWKTLLDSRVQKIAIGNPEHAPYGRAAVAAIRKAGIYDQVSGKFVLGENISQAAQFVESGNAQAGIVAVSLAISPAMKDGKRWEIPLDLYAPLEQAVVLLNSSPEKSTALAFLAFLKTDEARATLTRYGFALPSTADPAGHKP